jgi:hypothetical protein
MAARLGIGRRSSGKPGPAGAPDPRRCRRRPRCARKDGPLVELAIGNGRWRSRSPKPPAGALSGLPFPRRCSSKPVFAQPRPAWSSTCAKATCATSSSTNRRRSTVPIPGVVAPADLVRPTPHLRARRYLTPARRSFRLERLCLRPPGRRWLRRRTPRRASTAHSPLLSGGQPDRHRRRRRQELSLVGHEERVVRAPRRRRFRAGGALYSGFSGEPFADDSREYVFVAHR